MAVTKALKRIYLLCMALIVFIASVFIYVWQKEAGEEKLLKEKGLVVEAWVLNLSEHYSQKRGGKKLVYQHYMDVAFFADTTAAKPVMKDTAVSQAKNGSDLVDKLANKIAAERTPLGNYLTLHIPISPGAYKKYNRDDKVKVVYLNDNMKVARLQEELH
jgi:hypothetical protein